MHKIMDLTLYFMYKRIQHTVQKHNPFTSDEMKMQQNECPTVEQAEKPNTSQICWWSETKPHEHLTQKAH